MTLLCRLGLHYWTHWRDYNLITRYTLAGKEVGAGNEIRQKRRCLRCNLEQKRDGDS